MASNDTNKVVTAKDIKPREWYIGMSMEKLANSSSNSTSVWDAYMLPNKNAQIHVREVLPESITITRDDLKAGMSRCSSISDKDEELLEWWFFGELPPEGTQASKIGTI